MKIAVTGKGGTGKTTLSGILCHLFKQDGYRVLAVDADPDANLASALGIPLELAASIKPIAEQRQLIRERTGAEPDQFGQLFKINPLVSDLPDNYSLDYQGIRLLVMGGAKKGGAGCACPENVLLKSLLSEIILRRDEVVIVDMEAGIEHLGRATAQAIDIMLIVVEPGTRSIQTAETIMKMGVDLGLKQFWIIGNKLQNEAQSEWISNQFQKDMILGMIPFSTAIQEADLLQTASITAIPPELKQNFIDIYENILKRAGDEHEI
jgi:CO dehydrogenase maturation factor